MQALDLTHAPPRPARAALDGIVFLARSIDKVRATLPGGRLNAYTVPGLTQTMLDHFGITLAEFTAAVEAADDDAAVVHFVRSRVAPETIAQWNATIAERLPRNGDRVAALGVYPWLADRPELPLILDVLDEDDRRHYAAGVA